MNIENKLKQPYYFNPKIIFVITWDNKFRVLRCPFTVIAIKPIHNIIEGETYLVNNVKETKAGVTVFEINNCNYRCFYFNILI